VPLHGLARRPFRTAPSPCARPPRSPTRSGSSSPADTTPDDFLATPISPPTDTIRQRRCDSQAALVQEHSPFPPRALVAPACRKLSFSATFHVRKTALASPDCCANTSAMRSRVMASPAGKCETSHRASACRHSRAICRPFSQVNEPSSSSASNHLICSSLSRAPSLISRCRTFLCCTDTTRLLQHFIPRGHSGFRPRILKTHTEPRACRATDSRAAPHTLRTAASDRAAAAPRWPS
jgi:hypothetical protein